MILQRIRIPVKFRIKKLTDYLEECLFYLEEVLLLESVGHAGLQIHLDILPLQDKIQKEKKLNIKTVKR